jgi:hypothetical protein
MTEPSFFKSKYWGEVTLVRRICSSRSPECSWIGVVAREQERRFEELVRYGLCM